MIATHDSARAIARKVLKSKCSVWKGIGCAAIVLFGVFHLTGCATSTFSNSAEAKDLSGKNAKLPTHPTGATDTNPATSLTLTNASGDAWMEKSYADSSSARDLSKLSGLLGSPAPEIRHFDQSSMDSSRKPGPTRSGAVSSEHLPLPIASSPASASKAAAKAPPSPPYVLMRVYYATDRMPLMPLNLWRANLRAKGSAYAYYGPNPGDLEFGQCQISIPTSVHQEGVIERPGLSRIHFKESIEKDFTLQSLKPLSTNAFYAAVKKAVAKSDENDAFVFIHGYNVRFNAAAMRTAQLAYDLQFKGAAILYSWAADGETLQYLHDENAVHWTTKNLEHFLRQLATTLPGTRIHIISHSMGNRALTHVLEIFASEADGPRFEEIIMAAPDVSRNEFIRDTAPIIGKIGRRVTLYASSRDRALMVAEGLQTFGRLGQGGANLVIVEGMDTLDASRVDTDFLGHSFFSEARMVLHDINVLIHAGDDPDHRRGLIRLNRGDLSYWLFSPK